MEERRRKQNSRCKSRSGRAQLKYRSRWAMAERWVGLMAGFSEWAAVARSVAGGHGGAEMEGPLKCRSRQAQLQIQIWMSDDRGVAQADCEQRWKGWLGLHAKDAAPATPLTAAERGHCIEAQKFPWLNCAVFIFYSIPHQHALVNFSSCELSWECLSGHLLLTWY